MGLKVSVYGVKGECLWEATGNPRPATAKIGIFRLKVIVYGVKGDICIEKR